MGTWDGLRLLRSRPEPSGGTPNFTEGVQALSQDRMVALTQCHTFRFEVFSLSCFELKEGAERFLCPRNCLSMWAQQGLALGSYSTVNKRVEVHERVHGS